MRTSTTLKTRIVVTYFCENCGKKSKFQQDYSRTVSGHEPDYSNLAATVRNKDFRPLRCPHCGYLQSWMWPNAMSNKLSCSLGFILFFALLVVFIATGHTTAAVPLALVLSVAIVSCLNIVATYFLTRRDRAILTNKGRRLSASSIRRITEKLKKRPELKPQVLNAVVGKEFATEDELLEAISALEGGKRLVSECRGLILNNAFMENEPIVEFRKPLSKY